MCQWRAGTWHGRVLWQLLPARTFVCALAARVWVTQAPTTSTIGAAAAQAACLLSSIGRPAGCAELAVAQAGSCISEEYMRAVKPAAEVLLHKLLGDWSPCWLR
jgi:hypothetical protein